MWMKGAPSICTLGGYGPTLSSLNSKLLQQTCLRGRDCHDKQDERSRFPKTVAAWHVPAGFKQWVSQSPILQLSECKDLICSFSTIHMADCCIVEHDVPPIIALCLIISTIIWKWHSPVSNASSSWQNTLITVKMHDAPGSTCLAVPDHSFRDDFDQAGFCMRASRLHDVTFCNSLGTNRAGWSCDTAVSCSIWASL